MECDGYAQLLSQLIIRLSELEWKVSKLGTSFLGQSVPKGLFRFGIGSNNSDCIAEIKADIHALSQQKNNRSAFYLAHKIRQKINVLVVLCQIQSKKKKSDEKVSFGIKMLSTRQQWIGCLETEINTLARQQQSMVKTLAELNFKPNPDAILHLKVELGEVERRLTLTKEALNRVVS